MSSGPNFYCDFYCAARDGLREPGAGNHQAGSRVGLSARLAALQGANARRRAAWCPRPSGSSGVQWPAQRLIPVGRPGIDGLRVCETSPLGSIRRGR